MSGPRSSAEEVCHRHLGLVCYGLLANVSGDEYFVASSFKTILDEAAELPLAKANVQMSTKVIGITAFLKGDKTGFAQCVHVQTDKGVVQTFDEIIVAVPLGCLKRNKHMFIPPLQPNLTAAIDAISVGHLEKVWISAAGTFVSE